MTNKEYVEPLVEPCEICNVPVLYSFSLCNACYDEVNYSNELTGNYHMKNGEIIDTTKCILHFDDEELEEINAMIQSLFQLLEALDSWKINKHVKEKGLLHEKRARMREVLQRNIDECNERIAFGEKAINEFVSTHEYLQALKEEWERGNIERADKIITCVFCKEEINSCLCSN